MHPWIMQYMRCATCLFQPRRQGTQYSTPQVSTAAREQSQRPQP
jgi:hypothetical protein